MALADVSPTSSARVQTLTLSMVISIFFSSRGPALFSSLKSPFLALVISATMTALVLGSVPSAANSVLLRMLRPRCRDRAEDWILVSFAVRIAAGHRHDHLGGQVPPKGALRSIAIAFHAQLASEMALLYQGVRGREVHDQGK